jgi:hypothetical protein
MIEQLVACFVPLDRPLSKAAARFLELLHPTRAIFTKRSLAINSRL